MEKVLGPLMDRWAWVRTAVTVQQRFSELHGGHLASAITLATFLSIFPLLLVGVAVVGFLAGSNSDLTADVISGLGLTGMAAEVVENAIDTAQDSRRAASVLGLLGLAWSGLGLVMAVSAAFDVVWQVRGRGLKDRLVSVAWLLGASLIFVATFGVTTVVNFLPGVLAPLSIVLGLVLNTALWLWTFRALTNVQVTWRAMLPGAVMGAVGLEILKFVGSFYIPRAVASSSALYGSIGVVFALIAWLFLLGRLIVYSAVLNVVRWEEDNGTVTAEIRLPRHPETVPLETTRSGEARDPVRA